LRLEDQGCARSIEESLATTVPSDSKGEWGLCHGEDEIAIINITAWWARENGFRYLIDLLRGIVDLDVQSCVCTCQNLK